MKSIHQYNFFKTKYGDELLIDVITLESIQKYIRKNPVHRLTYYDITFITEGKGEISINNHTYNVESAYAVCSIPGDVWGWEKDNNLNGFVLVFEEEFLLSFFNDPDFLLKFPYLHPERNSALVNFQGEFFDRIIRLLADIKQEIQNYVHKDHHILRAMLYEVLMLLNRCQTVLLNAKPVNDMTTNRYLNSFMAMVFTDYELHKDTQYYAGKLNITTNYLNKIVRQSLGMSTKDFILDKVIQEAKMMLKFTTLSVAEISEKLKFSTPTYFSRFFLKQTKMTPKEFRKAHPHQFNEITSPEK